jgi:hypothetical protein
MALDTIPKQEGGKLKAVASGTLPSGQPVVVNADGTVSVVAEIAISQAVGSPTVFESANSNDTSAIFDPNANKVVIAYRDRGNSDYGTAIVGTVSDMSISFGSPVVFETATSITISATFDSNANKVVIAYEDIDNSNGKAIVGTVSGTSISFGTAAVFASNVNTISAAYDSNAQKVVIAYRNLNNSNYGTAVVGTVSGTSISFGSSTVFNSALTQDISAVYDSNAQKVVIAYRDDGNSDYGTAVVGTVSGTSISFGSTTVFNSASPTYISATFDSNAQKVVIAYRDQGSYGLGTAIVGTVSGTSISFGTKVVFNNSSGISNYISATFDSNANKVVIAYRDDGNSEYGTVVAGTVSGTSISFGSPTVFESANSISMSTTFDSNANKVVISYIDLGSSGYGTASVFRNAGSEPNLTSENYIGMSGGLVKTLSQDEETGTPSVFATNQSLQSSSAYDSSSNKTILAWRDDHSTLGFGKVVVITVDGTSISYGNTVTFNSGSTRIPSVVYDSSNNKIVIAYRDDSNSNYATAIVGTVSGTSISFGTPVVYQSTGSSAVAATYDSANSKVVVTASSKFWVGTVSGTSISFGSSVSLAGTYDTNLTYDSTNNKVIAVLFADVGAGQAYVGEVSGTSISFGSATTFDNTNFNYLGGVVHDPVNNKIIISYISGQASAIVGTVSGTSITFGAEQTVAASSNDIWLTYDSRINKPVFAYKNEANSNRGTVVVGTVSGTSISFSSPTVFETGESVQIFGSFNAGEGTTVISFMDGGNNDYGTAVGYQASGSYVVTAEVADGDNATVDIVGTVSTNQLSLTAGQQYYVQIDGTLSETPADPSVLAGTAISATKLVVKA